MVSVPYRGLEVDSAFWTDAAAACTPSPVLLLVALVSYLVGRATR
jgi:hypothetical protein